MSTQTTPATDGAPPKPPNETDPTSPPEAPAKESKESQDAASANDNPAVTKEATPTPLTEAPAKESKKSQVVTAETKTSQTKRVQTSSATSNKKKKKEVGKITREKSYSAPAQRTKKESTKANAKRVTLVAALKEENTRLRRELAKAKETIARLKRGQRIRSANTTLRNKKPAQNEAVPRPKKKVTRVSSRLYNPKHEQNKANKRANAKKITELGECSFKPTRVAKIEPKKALDKKSGKLAFSRLYLDADRLARKRAEQAQEAKDKKIRRFSFTPEVSEKSKKLQEGVSRRERMCRLSEPKPKPEDTAPTMQKEDLIECTFKPRINPDNVYTPEGPLHQRLYQAGLEAKEKMAKLREDKANREAEQALGACTFQPNSDRATKRTPGEMKKVVERLAVKDVERRLDNMNNSVKADALGLSFTPEINQKTLDLTNSRSGNITQRLYTVKIPITDAPLDEECTFTPAVTQMAFEVDRSELPVHERLALHRSPSQREAFADMDGYENGEESGEGEGEGEEYDEDGEGEEEEIAEAEDESDYEGESEEDITF